MQADMKKFITDNHGTIVDHILSTNPGVELSYDDIEDIVINDEYLYEWARAEGVDV